MFKAVNALYQVQWWLNEWLHIHRINFVSENTDMSMRCTVVVVQMPIAYNGVRTVRNNNSRCSSGSLTIL